MLRFRNENSLFLSSVTWAPPVSDWGGRVAQIKREVGKEERIFFWDCDSSSLSSLECHETFLSIRYLLVGRKRLIAWDLNCHFMHNTLTDQCKNKPTRNYILKMYKGTELTKRELADSILNSLIKDRRGSCWNCASYICTDFMYLVLSLSSWAFIKGSGLFLTSGRGG